MSKVSIEIDGLKFGLRVSPEIALQLVEALQGVWVAAARHKRGECFLGDVAKARDAAKSVIVSMTVEIFWSMRAPLIGAHTRALKLD